MILDRISYHAVYDDSILDALRYALDNGFTGVQVDAQSPHLSFERLTDADCREIREFVARNSMRLIVHTPDDNVSLYETSRYLREGILSYYEALFDFAERAGAQMVTFHLGNLATWKTDTEPFQPQPAADIPVYHEALKSSLERLIEMAGGRFVLCLENFKLNVLEMLQSFLDDGRLSLCWDLPKTAGPEHEAFLWKNLKHIRQVHLHDVRDGRSHRVIGTGEIDFMCFLPRLGEAGVMDFCIEVRPCEKALESLQNLKTMLNEKG
jgi:sugar phosphate isomerase/epimerase